MRKLIIIGVAALVLVLAVPAIVLGNTALPTSGQNTASPSPSPNTSGEESPLPWIGVELGALNAHLAQALGLSQQSGVVVLLVIKDSPADAAQLRRGDIIRSVDGTLVEKAKDVDKAVRGSSPGSSLTLKILRGAEEKSIVVTVRAHPWRTRPEPLLWPRFFRLLGPGDGKVQRAEITLQGPDGNPVALSFIVGTINALAQGTVTVTPTDGSPNLVLTVGDAVHIVKGGHQAALKDLAVGDKVAAVRQNGVLVALVVGPLGPGLRGGDSTHHGLHETSAEMEGTPGPPRLSMDGRGARGTHHHGKRGFENGGVLRPNKDAHQKTEPLQTPTQSSNGWVQV